MKFIPKQLRCQIVRHKMWVPNCPFYYVGTKLSNSTIVILVSNFPFAFLVLNCPFLLSWCQIVRCQIIRVPNCPITHIWKQHISKRGFPFLEWLIFCWSAQTSWFAGGETFCPHLWCQKWWWRCSGWPSGEQLSHWALCSSHALDSTLFPLFSLFAEYLRIGINSYLMEWESGRAVKWWIQGSSCHWLGKDWLDGQRVCAKPFMREGEVFYFTLIRTCVLPWYCANAFFLRSHSCFWKCHHVSILASYSKNALMKKYICKSGAFQPHKWKRFQSMNCLIWSVK